MSLQNWKCLGLAIVVATAVSQAAWAEDGRPSRQALEQMGLGGIVVMSDDEALTVRGHGYKGGGSSAMAFGNSFATINGGAMGGAHSQNAYIANGKHVAKGDNFSFAGVVHISTGGKKKKDHGGGGGGYGGMGGQGGHGGGGGGYGGGGGHGGGKINISAKIFFAGGSSSAWAF
jgi:hypothetical protein